jgi:hypothetical protein
VVETSLEQTSVLVHVSEVEQQYPDDRSEVGQNTLPASIQSTLQLYEEDIVVTKFLSVSFNIGIS